MLSTHQKEVLKDILERELEDAVDQVAYSDEYMQPDSGWSKATLDYYRIKRIEGRVRMMEVYGLAISCGVYLD
jgi:hypothetical protein